MPSWFFATLCSAGFLAWTAPVPTPVPAYALQAEPVYRLEVGGACFSTLYLAAIAFFLALDGRGFAEVGSRGVKVDQVIRRDNDQDENLAENMKLYRSMRKNLGLVEATLTTTTNHLRDVDRRVRKLEEERTR